MVCRFLFHPSANRAGLAKSTDHNLQFSPSLPQIRFSVLMKKYNPVHSGSELKFQYFTRLLMRNYCRSIPKLTQNDLSPDLDTVHCEKTHGCKVSWGVCGQIHRCLFLWYPHPTDLRMVTSLELRENMSLRYRNTGHVSCQIFAH
jgi:hypothetical protein